MRTASSEELVESLRETLAYLEEPEPVRNIEALAANQVALQELHARFETNFVHCGESVDTTAACRLCAWGTSGTLHDVRGEALAHLHEAHAVAA